MKTLQVQCAIAGGGPAGMMLGLLLARAGIKVAVLEKHADFLRDFRGDTVHPSTLELMHELGLLEEFLKRPHQEVGRLVGWVGNVQLTVADFSKLPTRCKFIAFVPQWEFLDFIADEAKKYPAFNLIMRAEVTALIEEKKPGLPEDNCVLGVRAATPEGALEVRASLVVGADGRHSVVREKAGLEIQDLGAPIDVFWMQISRRPDDVNQSFGRFDRGKVMAVLNRETYWQCAYVISKGRAEAIRKQGLDSFRANIAAMLPFLQDRVGELRSWDDVKLLTVQVDRLKQWYRPGLLCIGDAAHAMSPIGGVGINLAVQDAAAAANILTAPLKQGSMTTDHLKQVQRRRSLPTAVIQRLQVLAQNNIFRSALAEGGWTGLPLPFRLLRRFPALQRIPGRLIGLGFRPEHIQK